MPLATQSTKVALAMVMTFVGSQVRAQSASSTEAEIAVLKKQLRLMEEKLDRLQKQTAAKTVAAAKANAKTEANAKVSVDANGVVPVKAPAAPPDTIVKMPNNRPTVCTADEQNCIALTSRLHFDAGGYDYRPNTTATVPQRLDDGVNARRARIGVIGKFLGDWDYALIYDFAGSSDGFASTASAGGTAVGFLPGGRLSGIDRAYLSYTGIKPFGGQLAIEGGYMKIPYTLEEAMSSNDILFLEHASSAVIAAKIAAGGRSTAGARWYNDVLWAGAYATGPKAGDLHSASSTNPNGTTEQFGATARVAGQVISGNDYSLHLGADAEFLIRPPHNLVDNSFTLKLRDRPELRIDPTDIIDTGSIAGVSGAQVYSAEAAAAYGPLFFQGEYFWYNVARNNLPGLPNLKFQGGYAEASLVLTGETHPYIPAYAAYGGIIPANPFSLWSGGWGAWEIAGRISTMNLNDQLGTTNGVAGGQQTIYGAGLNWYVNSNIRFMFDYLHGDVAKQVSPTNSGNAGTRFDAFAMRTQVAF
jgi:phosphate-selective porin OprO and OprP